MLVSSGVLRYVPAMMSKQSPDSPGDQTTHFGFRDVPEAEKASMVRDVFDSVAGKYDLMNDLMSLGVHRLWKNAMIEWLRPRADMTLVDVGGGTGDIAFKFLAHGGGPVTVIDINAEMLAKGRDRALDKGILQGISWLNGDAEALPLEDMSADAYTIAFCIRNVTHIERALSEARRVLKPGGRFLCLEFSHVTAPMLAKLYDTYSFKVLPVLGANVAGDREAYQYLAESIRKFPDQQRFAEMIADAGLGNVDVRNLSGGIAALHSAWRI
jgi:demethylmenaquinone methyltransferase / 2-methoxy-6-polyprenyl-1,4-benzoquinol methylase